MTAHAPQIDKLSLIQRVALFVLLGWLGMLAFPLLFAPLAAGPLAVSAFSSFAAGAVANAVVVRIYARGRLGDFGLAWSSASAREFLLGAAAGAGAATATLGIPLLLRLARFERSPLAGGTPWAALGLVAAAILFGAAGEEMLFHGYAFQVLLAPMGAFATILPVAAVFGAAHLGNRNATLPGIFNTFAWGILLGYACWRTGALWLPIGLHFGWNFTLPLFGANLSGFTMGLTGYALHWSAGPLWSGGDYGPEGSLLTTLAVVAAFPVVARVSRKEGS
jgi:CAAX protease family protein